MKQGQPQMQPPSSTHRARRAISLATGLALLVLLAAQAAPASAAECANEAIREQQNATYLPDCRAYEQVSPAYKNGFTVTLDKASEDGTHLLLRSNGIFSDPPNTGTIQAAYVAHRTSFGWESSPLAAPPAIFREFEVVSVTPDFEEGLFIGSPPSQQAATDIYRVASKGPFAPVDLGPMGPPTVNEETMFLRGVSRDLLHSVYSVLTPNLGGVNQLWPGDGTIGPVMPSLYEYSGTGNTEPRLVGVSDEGPVAQIAESHLISQCGTYFGGVDGNVFHAISESGATIFFTALGEDHVECGGLGAVEPPVDELFARIDGEHTLAISEPSPTDCTECATSSPADAEFQGASEDGSRAFFTTAQPLLGSDATQNLYLYDFNAPQGERVTEVSATADPEGARVQRVLSVSEDATHVYFTAQGLLASNQGAAEPQPGAHPKAQEGAENLYLYERDAAHPHGQLSFIASGAFGKNVQATPDGRFLLFESPSDLTADQDEAPEAGQLFRYDAASETLIRVSRAQDGFNEDGNSSVFAARIPSLPPGAFPTNQYSHLALSADGAYVFFTSADALTPQVTGGTTNVYSYHDGQVSLISDGHEFTMFNGEPAVEFLGTDRSGRDVYFRTADRLLPGDTDTQLDIYDARVEGGFPPPPPGPDCEADSCQGTTSPSPASATPASAAISGPGNVRTTDAQLLARALKACRRRHNKRRRVTCERSAHEKHPISTPKRAGAR